MKGGLAKKPTQCERIMQYIRDFGSITAYQAVVDLGIMQLASRVFEMEEKGVVFDKSRVQKVNRYGEKVSFVEYSLKEVMQC